MREPIIVKLKNCRGRHQKQNNQHLNKRPCENNSIGVLLCKGKDTEVVEYAMARNTSPAMIADYETKLIPKSYYLINYIN